ncbi:Zinc finger SWIM domain-containing protein 3 [Phytophthora citrophthora]|uniref:Zinc finger SWIM domain-containing protein 3 n=1 Tax=Phytophthora citrophthora TaxID=4793 RepID=A0AAD9LAF8_9STRA|nr:Zinc finger SWIM domain-containing protein 3 [Phytophthora citrophthora]
MPGSREFKAGKLQIHGCNKKPCSGISLKRHSPHEAQPSFPKRRMLDVQRDTHDNDSGEKPLTTSEYSKKKRTSKHLEELDSINPGGDGIVNMVPALGSYKSYETWEEFEEVYSKYKKKNKLKFRVWSSEKTALYNRRVRVLPENLPVHTRSIPGIQIQSPPQPQDSLLQVQSEVNGRSQPNHTRSHPTTGTEAPSYLTTKTLPLDDEDREDVKTLADARVSYTHITNFLNDRLGCKVTPQPTRNLLRSIAGQDSGEDHMKNMLHALRQLDGSDVLVIQDQFDVTCGVVMQTKVQKMMFERWGDTLAMDFTHGTNNLGYHLGSLVVTTCTGRGFPAVDFICLNEQATTISTILEYFKEKNPLWENVVSVVIDKDFTEWKVLEECFPKAKILLCQFHAISNWKKVIKRSIYGIKIAQGEELLCLMIKLLYSPTHDAYDSHYRNLKDFCHRNKKQGFFADFDKNWNSCNEMWSNFARGKYFTAGNTTTNRIESNWNQLKMLLGLKTRIDQTIAGLLQHLMTIIQQIVLEIGQLHSSSRRPQTVVAWCLRFYGKLVGQQLHGTSWAIIISLSGSQWGIIIIQLELSGGQLHVRPHMYEPLIIDCYHEEMETIWNGVKREGLRGFIDRWHKSSNPGSKMNVDPVTGVDARQQPDNSSCGVLIVAHAHSVVTGSADLHCYNVSKIDVDVMRLRMLWLMLLWSRERRIPKVDASTAAEIDQKLQDQLR